MRRFIFTVILLAASSLSAAVFTGKTHPFTVTDLLAMERISEPTVSPDGKWIVFTVQKTDHDANRYRKDLWLIDTDGNNLRRLTTHEENDFNPRFSPDGKTIYFISSRSGSSQIWSIPLDGGEAQQITNLPLDVSNLIVSPTCKHIAYTLDVFADCNSIDCTKQRLEKIKNSKSSGQNYDKLFISHWDTWSDGRRSHLFVQPIDSNKPIDVMAGMDADTPSKPFGGPSEITFTPDGNQIIFTARNVGRSEAWSTNFDLYLAPIDGSKPPQNLTEKNKAWDTTPLFSGDGKTLYYLAMERPGYEADQLKIIQRRWPDGPERILTPDWDRSVDSYCFSKDGKTIYANAENTGQKSLFAIDTSAGLVRIVIEKGSVNSPAAADNRIVYCLDNFRSPAEIFICDSDGKNIRKLTSFNDEKIAAVRTGDFEQFSFKGWNDETVYGHIVRPIDFDLDKKYPVAFLIHGGPQGSFSNNFHYRWNAQIYAAAGYAAVLIDFHGSTGYGQGFCDSIRGDWGGKPLEDLQKGLQAALKKCPWMDSERIGALGGSFGGYMVNWIAGNWPDRFKCLVSHAGNLDERMAYFDTEELWFPEWDHLGTPWENPQSYEKHNPVNFVRKWKTPMLVIHGAKDYRVVDTQGLSVFTALQRLGIESKLLYFPDEGHWILKPNNSILWHNTVLSWLDQWLK